MSVYVKKASHVHNQYVDLEHHTHIASSHNSVLLFNIEINVEIQKCHFELTFWWAAIHHISTLKKPRGLFFISLLLDGWTWKSFDGSLKPELCSLNLEPKGEGGRWTSEGGRQKAEGWTAKLEEGKETTMPLKRSSRSAAADLCPFLKKE